MKKLFFRINKSNDRMLAPFVYVHLLLLIFFMLPHQGVGQYNTGIGYHGAAFLRISPAARQVAMGEAFSALADDINLMRYNIGALGNLRNIMLAANFHNWIGDTQQGSIGLSLPTRWGILGFDFSYFNEGQIVELDEFFRQTGGTRFSDDIMLTFGYGSYLKLLNNDFSFGGGLKLLRQNLVGEQNTNFALDIGAQFRLKHLSFAATVQNFGLSKVRFQEQETSLPMMYRLGSAARLPIGESLKLNLGFDVLWITSEKLRYFSGSELLMGDLLAIRGGYKFSKVAPSNWSFGFGINIPMEWLAHSKTRIDYSYSPMDVFQTSMHRFSLLFKFGAVQRVLALNVSESERLAAINERLQKELAELERAKRAAQEAEARTKAMEEEIARRLARIKKIAAESEGKIEVQPQTKKRILVRMRINFDFDKANIRPEDFKTMHQVGEILNTYPEAKVHISGHTDSVGPEEYNIRLSQRRVDSVMVFLAKKENVSIDRFYMPVGYGELRPIADNSTAKGRFLNRRVDFLLFTFDAQPEMPDGSAIERVEVVNEKTVRIVCNGKVKFKTKKLSNPERFIVDLPDVYLLSDVKSVALNRGPFIRARFGFHPKGRFSRVVFDLKRPIKAEVTAKDNFVIIKVK